MNEEQLRRELVSASHALHANGWVANHDGNISARLGEHLLCTPTAVSKGAVAPEQLIVVDGEGKVVVGTRKPFSELRLHRAVYRVRPDVAVVIHAHPPTATGFAVAGRALGAPFMAEPVVSLGAEIPTIPYGMVGDPALDKALAETFARCDAALLGGHGVLVVGSDVETALLRLELVEHLAKIALVAAQLGGARPIPAADVQTLLAQRAKAGLGLKTASDVVPPEPERWSIPTPSGPTDAAAIVNEALRRMRG